VTNFYRLINSWKFFCWGDGRVHIDISMIQAVQQFSKHNTEKDVLTLAINLDSKIKECSVYTLSVFIKHTVYISIKTL